jgi:hypothetical protein
MLFWSSGNELETFILKKQKQRGRLKTEWAEARMGRSQNWQKPEWAEARMGRSQNW